MVTWGDTVRVLADADATFRPCVVGSVCGLRDVEGETLVLVEFRDGVTTEIPAPYLAKIAEEP